MYDCLVLNLKTENRVDVNYNSNEFVLVIKRNGKACWLPKICMHKMELF